MSKRVANLSSKRAVSLSIILNLLLSVFAFTFVIYSAGGASAREGFFINHGTGIISPADDLPPGSDATIYSTYADAESALRQVAPAPAPDAGAKIGDPANARISADATAPLKNPSSTLPPKTYSLQQPAYYSVGGKNYQVVSITRTSDPNVYDVKLSNGETYQFTQEKLTQTGWKLDAVAGRGETPYTSSIFGNLGRGPWAYGLDNILTGFQYSLFIVGGIQLIGTLFGLDSSLTNALSLGAFAGIMSGEIAKTLFVGSDALLWPSGTAGNTGFVHGTNIYDLSGLIGIAVGVLTFLATYTSTDKQTVNFQCNVWAPPKGGEDCEKCNVDSRNFPCTEYKCRSLGAGCELKNQGTGEEICVWVNERDVTSPIIMPNYENISSGYEYANVHIRPPGIGMEIKNTDLENNPDGCVEAFFPLMFGVSTNKPTHCKIDYNHTKSFDDMKYDFGNSATFKYNHTQTLSLPGPANINSEFPEIKNDGVYNLFVRCEDANGKGNEAGNVNEDEFAIKFCVKPGPDTTPARIVATNLLNGAPVSYNNDKLDIKVYTNEPADCKWSKEDKDYDVMENTMACSRSVTDFNANLLYACSGKLTGIEDRKENKFFFRCKDQPTAEESDRNINEESYEFMVRGTQPLNILSVGPNGTIQGSTSVVSVNLLAETANGYQDGNSICYFSTTGNEKDYVKFFETGSSLHRQRQDLTRGDYTYYIKCVDLGGNADYNKTRVKIDIDERAPRVVRVKHDSGESSICGAAGCLRVTTDEDSVCSYSTSTCNFELNNGIKLPYENTKEHYAAWNTNFNYYIKCADKSGNQPGPAQCSMVVKAVNSK